MEVPDLRPDPDPDDALPARGPAALAAGAPRNRRRRGARRCDVSDAAPLLSVDALTVRFGGLTAVDGVSFSVDSGRIVSLIGPNGAGKTTVFNAITALHPASAGDIRFAGRTIARTFDARTALRIAVVAIACAVAFQIGYAVEDLWDAAILAHYRYQQPFPWASALASAWKHLVGHGPWPAIVGALVGGAGAFNVWWGTRRTPDLVFARGIARTFQNIRLFKEMTCRENLLVAMASARRWRWANPLAAALRLPAFRRGEEQAAAAALEHLRFAGL
ncbi:MAG: ATP-binding cassette domain-containing protein, partial [Planctomycetes bacterium]|nr:ATP-binding cassette domain-containing protein [Planctomycetota bacterium]